jgi:hypothetical protein
MNESEKNFHILRELYHELRNYRDKEFKTFTFTFPIIAIGLIPKVEIANLLAITILTSFFGIIMIIYLYKNHNRMSKIKIEIYEFQEKESLNSQFKSLNPKDWVHKKTENHLGTMTYIGILSFEIALVWCFYIWFFINIKN